MKNRYNYLLVGVLSLSVGSVYCAMNQDEVDARTLGNNLYDAQVLRAELEIHQARLTQLQQQRLAIRGVLETLNTKPGMQAVAATEVLKEEKKKRMICIVNDIEELQKEISHTSRTLEKLNQPLRRESFVFKQLNTPQVTETKKSVTFGGVYTVGIPPRGGVATEFGALANVPIAGKVVNAELGTGSKQEKPRKRRNAKTREELPFPTDAQGGFAVKLASGVLAQTMPSSPEEAEPAQVTTTKKSNITKDAVAATRSKVLGKTKATTQNPEDAEQK